MCYLENSSFLSCILNSVFFLHVRIHALLLTTNRKSPILVHVNDYRQHYALLDDLATGLLPERMRYDQLL